MTAGTVTLVGGGWGTDAGVWQPFLTAAADRAAAEPRIAVIAVRDGDQLDHAAKLVTTVRTAGAFEPRVVALPEGGRLDPAVLDDVDGVFVGGGLTPAYHELLAPHADRFRTLVAAGVPYAGFSAGSAIAAGPSLLGGWRLPDGVPVVDEEVAEELDGLTVRSGFGLVPFAVDVHAAQWGTLARLIAAVGAGLAPDGVAIDEDTAVVVRDGAASVVGAGSAWWVSRGAEAVSVRRESAS